MNPKQYAEHLVNQFIKVEYLKDYEGMYKPLAIQCALICVDEFLNYYGADAPYGSYEYDKNLYYQEVKRELLKM